VDNQFRQFFNTTGLIFRGITPEEAVNVVGAAIEEGLTIVEVPLNSPSPLTSIKLLSTAFSDQALVGAGTVTCIAEVEAVAEAGGKIIVTPYARVDVVKRAKQLGLFVTPGALTPTEIAAMHDAGADAVKIFPADLMGPSVLKGLRAVLPPDLMLVPVGGISLENMEAYVTAGAAGFGLGSSLYRAGDSVDSIREKAKCFIQHMKYLHTHHERSFAATEQERN
jgi:2-dehydro-3-deoxyphosphogalactonate aldolase